LQYYSRRVSRKIVIPVETNVTEPASGFGHPGSSRPARRSSIHGDRWMRSAAISSSAKWPKIIAGEVVLKLCYDKVVVHGLAVDMLHDNWAMGYGPNWREAYDANITPIDDG
jgi:hypothetical protein